MMLVQHYISVRGHCLATLDVSPFGASDLILLAPSRLFPWPNGASDLVLDVDLETPCKFCLPFGKSLHLGTSPG